MLQMLHALHISLPNLRADTKGTTFQPLAVFCIEGHHHHCNDL